MSVKKFSFILKTATIFCQNLPAHLKEHDLSLFWLLLCDMPSTSRLALCIWHIQKARVKYSSLAHKSNFTGHVIVTTGLLRMHFPRPGFFLRWRSNLQQVDFSQGFPSNILGPVVLAEIDGFLHLHTRVISPFFCLHFCHLEIQI